MELQKPQQSTEDRLSQIEKKVDKLLRYQRQARFWYIAKLTLQILTIIAIILLPILAYYWVVNWIQESVGLTMQEFGELLNRLRSLTDIEGGFERLKLYFK
jgi:hypothetical protein